MVIHFKVEITQCVEWKKSTVPLALLVIQQQPLLPHRISSNISDGEDEREFDNPIYGSEENDENVYDAPVFNKQGSESPPDHEFDNQIYGCEEDEADLENGYSLASACYFAIYNTVTDNGLSESDKNVND